MNTTSTPKPTWITLYSISLIGLAALFFTPSLHAAPMMHTIVMLLVVAALYSVIGLWIQANSTALVMEDDQRQAEYTIHYDVMHTPEMIDEDAAETPVTEIHDHMEAA